MTPRDLRSAIKRGEVIVTDPKLYKGHTPIPPPEWSESRQDRLQVAVRAAILFLQDFKWQEIGKELEAAGLLEQVRTAKGPLVSKARIQQYCDKGLKFLDDRGCFRPLSKPDPKLLRNRKKA